MVDQMIPFKLKVTSQVKQIIIEIIIEELDFEIIED